MMRAFPIATVLLALAGCGPLVQIGGNDKPPTALLTLTATAVAPPGALTTPRKDTVLVTIPAVTGILQTLRLPVITSDTSLAYLTGATWAVQPNRQMQRILADTIEANGVVVLDPNQAVLANGRTLTSTLMECALDVRDPAKPVVRMRLDAVLAGAGTVPLATQRFTAVEPVTSQSPGDVAIALNTAANRVAGDVARWVKQ